MGAAGLGWKRGDEWRAVERRGDATIDEDGLVARSSIPRRTFGGDRARELPPPWQVESIKHGYKLHAERLAMQEAFEGEATVVKQPLSDRGVLKRSMSTSALQAAQDIRVGFMHNFRSQIKLTTSGGFHPAARISLPLGLDLTEPPPAPPSRALRRRAQRLRD